ncbi:MAG: hypothetical protein MUF84_14455 [Anaerolineae bacterium]|nr:hypothetical protein [Anaerolineae bacterium]
MSTHHAHLLRERESAPSKSGYPLIICVALTAACLLAFWISIPLPRIDNQLVGSDGIYYFAYLPSFWLDGDLDFCDEYAYFLPDQHLGACDPVMPSANKFGIGTAVLWSPFYLLAHAVALGLNAAGANISTEGYGYLYQSITLSGSILYGGLAMWLCFLLAERVTSTAQALVAAVLITFGGSMVYYMTAEPSMSHTVSAFLSSLFFLVWHQKRGHETMASAAIYGLLAGLMALVRPQDGVFLVLPFIARVPTVLASLGKPGHPRVWRAWLRDCAIAALVASLVFAPQMLVWLHFYGSPFTSGYRFYGESFNWLAPRIGAVLFSAQRGLLTWHPVIALALAGLWIGRRHNRSLNAVALLGIVAQLYLIASWHSWAQGDAFGGRMAIVCLPLLALGLAQLIEWAVERVRRTMVYSLGGVILVLNLLLFIEYRFSLVNRPAPTTWHDLTLGRVAFLVDVLTAGIGK